MQNTDQFLDGVLDIIDAADKKYREGVSVEKKLFIPVTDSMPLESNIWWEIEDVVCVFIDMKNSTKLSAEEKEDVTAKVYQYFTETAVRILNHFGASYIDVRGDGAFGLFDDDKIYHALCAAITFKSIVYHEMKENVKEDEIEIDCHIGIDINNVLVKRIGIRKVEGQSDKQNEVWAGKPVNMAAKLASKGGADEIYISDRVYKIFKEGNSELVMETCGCPQTVENATKTNIWTAIDLSDQPMFDFDTAYKMKNTWCGQHGRDFCLGIMRLDN